MLISPQKLKDEYRNLSVEELQEKYASIVARKTNKENFIADYVENYMDANHTTNNATEEIVVTELLKEKTGREYNIAESDIYDLYMADYGTYFGGKIQEEFEKQEITMGNHLIRFNDIFEYVKNKGINTNDENILTNFFANLNTPELVKITFFLNLYYDQEDYSKFILEASNTTDIETLHQKYDKLVKTFKANNLKR